jgi:hypothetical protein
MRPLSLHGGTGAPLQAAHKQYRLGGFRQHIVGLGWTVAEDADSQSHHVQFSRV